MESGGAAAAVADPEVVDLLVIDDDAGIRDLLVVASHRMGYSIRTARDGQAAQGQLARHRFRLIVTDIFMPKMDGYEVIMRVRAACPGMPVLAMTGGGISGGPGTTFVPARLMGCRKTLAKPFDMAEFIAAVREILATASPGVG